MKNLKEEALEIHRSHQGKLETKAKLSVKSLRDLSLVYSPGVAEPCLAIQENSAKLYDYTMKANTVAVISDGTSVLGLGDIGADASLPVMEGKAILLKNFAGVDAFPLCLDTKDPEEVIKTVKLLTSSFGGVNLEDIKAPNCFLIEKRLKEELDIPVFHDDQHGTAIVTLAGLINALKFVNKSFTEIKVVINGAGAAGIAIAKLLANFGVKELIMCDTKGAVYKGRQHGMNPVKEEVASFTNGSGARGTLEEVLQDSDVFIGVSAPGVLTPEMIHTMKKDPIVFAMANPDPEITPDQAKAAGVAVIGTGRSDFPNQVNNVLAFPGIFRGALDTRASDINEEMKVAAAYAIASLISDHELSADYIIPSAFDARVAPEVAAAVARAAIHSGVAGKNIDIDSLRTKTYQLSAIQVDPAEVVL
ncbi:NAD(P)-dependent malic enzyme [Pseudobacillus badius]|uniref:NAD(P)-dependent malic enzyme n=1 Tax=Bacillus badius TaxID=1455 RepID=UPI0007B0B6C0|nr:malic enzyme-like NAD(P)-binding protein [Bacillus badius]KZO00655.1 malate dehydrogenase [Bacillus badius]OCS88074.1 malate dehydrogenase [Bacillus badius]OVE53401.1 NAD-dependent malic enzyme [Bacillus badius]TDW05757.1 malate dehydrogenase (oxaloacetate-decarboxylating) [Bacillus badius]